VIFSTKCHREKEKIDVYGIYNIFNKDELIYIGKTINFQSRLRNHMSTKTWKNEITHISIAECKNKIDMDIYEKYYINKLNPKYNKAIVYGEQPTFKIDELNFKIFGVNEFFKPKGSKITESKNKTKNISVCDQRRNKINELIKNSIEIVEGEKVDFLNTTFLNFHWYNSNRTEITFLKINCNLEFFKSILLDIRNGKCESTEYKYKFLLKNNENICNDYKHYCISFGISGYMVCDKIKSTGNSIGTNITTEIISYENKDVEVHIWKNSLNDFLKYFTC